MARKPTELAWGSTVKAVLNQGMPVTLPAVLGLTHSVWRLRGSVFGLLWIDGSYLGHFYDGGMDGSYL